MFDELYVVVVVEVVAVTATPTIIVARSFGGDTMQYWEFNNIKPPKFDGVKDSITFMRCIYDVKGRFYTCLCPNDLKVHFTLNLLRLGVKDQWNFVTTGYSHT